jgi:hypothetical protein
MNVLLAEDEEFNQQVTRHLLLSAGLVTSSSQRTYRKAAA